MSACTPAPPEWMSVPSISKSNKRLVIIDAGGRRAVGAQIYGTRRRVSLQTLQRRCAHHQHGEHAAEERSKGNERDDEKDLAGRIGVLFLTAEWRGVREIDGRDAGFGRFDFDLLELGQRLRADDIRLVAGFERTEADAIVE